MSMRISKRNPEKRQFIFDWFSNNYTWNEMCKRYGMTSDELRLFLEDLKEKDLQFRARMLREKA